MSTSSNKALTRITIDEVVAMTGFSKKRIQNLIEHNSFPKPVKSKGTDTHWVKQKVSDWLRDQILERGY